MLWFKVFCPQRRIQKAKKKSIFTNRPSIFQASSTPELAMCVLLAPGLRFADSSLEEIRRELQMMKPLVLNLGLAFRA